MTKASFTDTQAISSTPLAVMASASAMKPGRCFCEQVGVKAPGTANSTTLRPAKYASVETWSMPSAVLR